MIKIVCKCKCGWLGVNLVPNFKDDTARCPRCNNVFVGITAENATIVSPEEEKDTLAHTLTCAWY